MKKLLLALTLLSTLGIEARRISTTHVVNPRKPVYQAETKERSKKRVQPARKGMEHTKRPVKMAPEKDTKSTKKPRRTVKKPY